ncbi:hypothetical protein D3C86_399900 [compost metagenome]
MSFNSYRAADGFGHSSSSFQIRLRPINAGMRQHKAGQGRAGQGRAGQGRAGQGRTGQGRTGQGQNMTGQDRNRARQDKTRNHKEERGSHLTPVLAASTRSEFAHRRIKRDNSLNTRLTKGSSGCPFQEIHLHRQLRFNPVSFLAAGGQNSKRT